jgi:hypothetical protein
MRAVFDALAVLLLLTRPQAGIVLTTLIIVRDVLINACVGLTYGFDLPPLPPNSSSWSLCWAP